MKMNTSRIRNAVDGSNNRSSPGSSDSGARDLTIVALQICHLEVRVNFLAKILNGDLSEVKNLSGSCFCVDGGRQQFAWASLQRLLAASCGMRSSDFL